MKKIAAILLLFSFVMGLGFSITAEAAGTPSIKAAERELKREKNYEPTDLYNRAHKIIYGKKKEKIKDNRVRLAIVISGDEPLMIEDGVKNQIYQAVRKKFPYEEFAVYKGTDVKTELLTREEDIYAQLREGHDDKKIYRADINDNKDVDGVERKERTPRQFMDLKLSDYVSAGRAYGYDYVFALALTVGGREKENHDWFLIRSQSSKQAVWVRVRLVDMAGRRYVYRNDIPVYDKSHHAYMMIPFPFAGTMVNGFNGRVLEKSIMKAMQEAMNDIEITGLSEDEE